MGERVHSRGGAQAHTHPQRVPPNAGASARTGMCARTHTRSTIEADALRGFAAPRQLLDTPTPARRLLASRLGDRGGHPEGPTAHHPAHRHTGAYV